MGPFWQAGLGEVTLSPDRTPDCTVALVLQRDTVVGVTQPVVVGVCSHLKEPGNRLET